MLTNPRARDARGGGAHHHARLWSWAPAAGARDAMASEYEDVLTNQPVVIDNVCYTCPRASADHAGVWYD